MRRILLTLVTVLTAFAAFAFGQNELYMPRNIKKAFANGTRAADGKPGPNYWQNKGVYNISLTVAPPERTIRGEETIKYTNNSPDPLKQLVMRLELNSHQPEAPRESPVSADYLTDGVHIDDTKVNGTASEFFTFPGLTYGVIRLAQPLAPHSTVELSIKWHVDMSTKTNREGAIDPTTFFIAYFYPRVAVYDDTDGWDTQFFTEGHEFYNDFNDYTFQVTAPKNFVVWATGDLLNPDETLQPDKAKRLKTSMTSDDVIHVATLDELKAGSVTQQTPTVTWKWKADNVSDVAIAVSDHYIWDAGSVIVDRSANRRASVQSAYDEASVDFQKMVEYGKHSLEFESNNLPGVPYPYQKTTIVRGFADMEYPMMVNDSSQKDPNATRFIVEHEILHTWFPFYMGINERRYGFMDEGWTTAFEYIIQVNDLGREKADEGYKRFRVARWIASNDADADLPIINPGDAATGSGFGNSEYGRAALGYLALRDLMGEAEFKRVLGEFIHRWNGKHTLPWDMFNSFNNISGKNMNWFFNNWFFSNGYIDIAVKNVEPSGSQTKVDLLNVGGFAAPTDIVVTYADNTTERFHETPAIWEKDQKETTVLLPTKQKVVSLTLDHGIWMDASKTNDVFPIATTMGVTH